MTIKAIIGNIREHVRHPADFALLRFPEAVSTARAAAVRTFMEGLEQAGVLERLDGLYAPGGPNGGINWARPGDDLEDGCASIALRAYQLESAHVACFVHAGRPIAAPLLTLGEETYLGLRPHGAAVMMNGSRHVKPEPCPAPGYLHIDAFLCLNRLRVDRYRLWAGTGLSPRPRVMATLEDRAVGLPDGELRLGTHRRLGLVTVGAGLELHHLQALCGGWRDFRMASMVELTADRRTL